MRWHVNDVISKPMIIFKNSQAIQQTFQIGSDTVGALGCEVALKYTVRTQEKRDII